jgi:hypothetical protein
MVGIICAQIVAGHKLSMRRQSAFPFSFLILGNCPGTLQGNSVKEDRFSASMILASLLMQKLHRQGLVWRFNELASRCWWIAF